MLKLRIVHLCLAAAFAFVAGLGFTNDAEAQKRVRWKLQSAFGSSLPVCCPIVAAGSVSGR